MEDFKSIIKNITIFLLLIFITFYIIFDKQDIAEVRHIISNVNIYYLLIGLFCMCIYYLFEAINIKSVLKALGKKVKLRSTYRYTLIGYFFSGITPAASGGQPMEIYFMHKDNIPISYSTVALLVEIISFQIITITCCLIGAILHPDLLANGVIYLFITGVSLNVIALTTMIIGFTSEKLAKKIVNLFLEILKLFQYKKVEEKRKSIYATLAKYNESAKIIKNNKKIFIKSMILVLIQVAIYYTIPYWIYRGFGLNELNILYIMSVQALLFCSVSSIPLPGAVGISESAFLNIYKTIFGERLLTSATILNRFTNFYIFILVGSILTIYSVLRKKKNNN